MKNKSFYFLLLAVVMLCVSCDPPLNSCFWYVKNDTEQTLKMKYPYSFAQVNYYSTATLTPGDSVVIFSGSYEKGHNLSFNYYFESIANRYGKDVSWQILSESDEVLKTWSYSERGLSNQRFFEESQWSFYQRTVEGTFDGTGYGWTFEILPEDI